MSKGIKFETEKFLLLYEFKYTIDRVACEKNQDKYIFVAKSIR